MYSVNLLAGSTLCTVYSVHNLVYTAHNKYITNIGSTVCMMVEQRMGEGNKAELQWAYGGHGLNDVSFACCFVLSSW